jgi:hypothetical protein
MSLSGPHDYGSTPSRQGAINYARDLNIARALPIIKETLYSEHHNQNVFWNTLIRVLGPVFLLGAVVFSGLAFSKALNNTNAFGLQSKLVDTLVSVGNPNTFNGVDDPALYSFSASSAPPMQQWALRSGQWGSARSMTLALPNPTEMPENSLVFVRNTSAKWKNASNEWQGPSTFPLLVQISTAEGVPLTPVSLNAFNDDVFISAKNQSGKQEWYPALLMDGAL